MNHQLMRSFQNAIQPLTRSTRAELLIIRTECFSTPKVRHVKMPGFSYLRLVLCQSKDWAQVCGINRGHSAGRLSLQCDEGLVTSTFQAAAFRVAAIGAGAANGEPLGVSPRCTATPLAAVGDVVVCRELQPSIPRPASLLLHATPTDLHGGENGERN